MSITPSITQELPRKNCSIVASAITDYETVSSFPLILTYHNQAATGKRKQIHECKLMKLNW